MKQIISYKCTHKFKIYHFDPFFKLKWPSTLKFALAHFCPIVFGTGSLKNPMISHRLLNSTGFQNVTSTMSIVNFNIKDQSICKNNVLWISWFLILTIGSSGIWTTYTMCNPNRAWCLFGNKLCWVSNCIFLKRSLGNLAIVSRYPSEIR